jgi:hypothetical protein
VNEPKERPILFSGPMIRAILDGRKTQTRRMIKHRENRWECGDDGVTGKVWPFWPCYVYGEPEPIDMPCPYGVAGDRLWVRETWAVVPHVTDNGPKHRAKGDGTGVTWRADWNANPSGFKWKRSIHMPRWASRITLEVTGVRVERLNEISRGDAMAEGCPHPNLAYGQNPCDWFHELWESINGPESWAKNPWVWVVEFQKVEAAK